MNRKNFFIGWENDMPNQSKKGIRRLLVACGIGVVVLAFILVNFSKPFNDHSFELGNVKMFSGVFYASPFPVLMLDEGQSPIAGVNQALLVGYGKNGAMTFVEPVAAVEGDLNGRRVKINGTLIYGDGKVIIELTQKEKSFVEITDQKMEGSVKRLGATQIEGEIMDPKCWFGVMKPGEGKVHKSCAIRCISGGIPPVLRMKEDQGNSYYILLGPDGEAINHSILGYVGEEITTQGEAYEAHGWKYIQVDPKAIRLFEH